MNLKRFFSTLFAGEKKPELAVVIHALSGATEAVYAANKRSIILLQKLGQRGAALLPQVIKAIEFAQQFLPNTGSGAARLEMVRKILQGIYQVANIQNLKFSEDWAIWLPVINTQVAELKDRSLLTSITAK